MITEARGRILLVAFVCGRCGKTHVEPYAKQLRETEGNLQCYKPPEGWKDDELYTPMLCDKCAKEYEAFMQMKNGEEQPCNQTTKQE